MRIAILGIGLIGGSLAAALRAAPSRAFAKLTEALARLGHWMGPGERCVDLGASPGGWSFVALGKGAQVIAVDARDHHVLQLERRDGLREILRLAGV